MSFICDELESSFKIRIEQINTKLRFMSFGLINESQIKNKEGKESSIKEQNKIDIWYGGFCKSDNLKGKITASKDKDINGLKEDFEFNINIKPENHIQFNNKEGTLDLFESLKQRKEPLYLYCKLLSKGDCVRIEKR